MIELITPPGMLLTTAMLAIYAAYAFLIGRIEKSGWLLAAGFVAVVATYGVAMLRAWSRYLVYLLTAGFLLKLGLSIRDGITSGFFGFFFDAPAAVLKSLAPSLVMALLSGICCYLVYRHFRPTTATPPLEHA